MDQHALCVESPIGIVYSKMPSKQTVYFGELAGEFVNVLGSISKELGEEAKHRMIFNKIEGFHDLFHQNKEFIAGESQLSYAGKV